MLEALLPVEIRILSRGHPKPSHHRRFFDAPTSLNSCIPSTSPSPALKYRVPCSCPALAYPVVQLKDLQRIRPGQQSTPKSLQHSPRLPHPPKYLETYQLAFAFYVYHHIQLQCLSIAIWPPIGTSRKSFCWLLTLGILTFRTFQPLHHHRNA